MTFPNGGQRDESNPRRQVAADSFAPPRASEKPSFFGHYAGPAGEAGPNDRYQHAMIDQGGGNMTQVPFVHEPGSVGHAFNGGPVSLTPEGPRGSYVMNAWRK